MSAWDRVLDAARVARGTAMDAVDGVVPAWVLRPESIAEVQACMRHAGETGSAIVGRGRGAHLDIGAIPARLDAVLSLERLAGVVDHQAGDMTVTVEAGCALPALAAVLARAGQWLPLDPPRADATTVGGLIAADLSGPLRASQGRVRDLLIGLRTVGADGSLVAGGGRVVKNVAGYDLPKLHVGALGTVGIIVEATFKVRPRPEREEAVVIAARSIEEAAETALALRDSPIEPFWLEVAGPGGVPEGPGDGAGVVVGIAGIAAEVAEARDRVIGLARGRGLGAVPVSDGAALRLRIAEFPAGPAAAVLRAAVLPTDVGALMTAAMAEARAEETDLRCLAHGANGVVRLAVTRPEAVPALVDRLRELAHARGGSVVVERAGPAVKASLDVWGPDGPAFELVRRVKAAFDPHAILAPGRFVGGL